MVAGGEPIIGRSSSLHRTLELLVTQLFLASKFIQEPRNAFEPLVKLLALLNKLVVDSFHIDRVNVLDYLDGAELLLSFRESLDIHVLLSYLLAYLFEPIGIVLLGLDQPLQLRKLGHFLFEVQLEDVLPGTLHSRLLPHSKIGRGRRHLP